MNLLSVLSEVKLLLVDAVVVRGTAVVYFTVGVVEPAVLSGTALHDVDDIVVAARVLQNEVYCKLNYQITIFYIKLESCFLSRNKIAALG